MKAISLALVAVLAIVAGVAAGIGSYLILTENIPMEAMPYDSP